LYSLTKVATNYGSERLYSRVKAEEDEKSGRFTFRKCEDRETAIEEVLGKEEPANNLAKVIRSILSSSKSNLFSV
jgi:hypothetical protein